MDFKDQLKQLGEKVCRLKDTVQTEEATKMAFIVPFLKALDYDFSDPSEMVPEYTCDIGTKKGEKIDYAILKNGEPIILVECKHCKQKLNLHEGQLLRYFHVSKARFGILTNGIEYLFYSDLAEPNKMDEKPFLEINFENLKDEAIEAVKKFHKSYFDLETISDIASELKYMKELKAVINSEISSPSEDFVRVLARQVYSGVISQKWLNFFTDLVKRAFSQTINEIISDRLESAIKVGQEKIEPPPEPEDDKIEPSEESPTEDELDGVKIVKALLSKNVSADRLSYKKKKYYTSIRLDGNKTICRLFFRNAKKKYIDVPLEGKRDMVELKKLDDINLHSDNLLKMVAKYEK